MINRNQIYIMGNIDNNIVKNKNGCEKIQNKVWKHTCARACTHTHTHTIHIPHYLSAAAKSLQSCPTLCDPIDGSPPGSPIPGILQARTLKWVAISFSNAWKWEVKVKSLSRVQLLATPLPLYWILIPESRTTIFSQTLNVSWKSDW